MKSLLLLLAILVLGTSFEFQSETRLPREQDAVLSKGYQKDDGYDVLFVAMLARHGARTPKEYFFNEEEWNGLPKKCMTPEGMRQHYVLGQLMRERYIPSLLSPVPMPEEAYMVSDFSQRTKLSAMSFVLGLYPAYTGQNIASVNEFSAVPPNSDPSITNIVTNMRLPNTSNLPAIGYDFGLIDIKSPIEADLLFNADDETVCKRVTHYLDDIKATDDYKNAKGYLDANVWQPLVDIVNSQTTSFKLKSNDMSFGTADDVYDSYISTQFAHLPNFDFPENILAGLKQTLNYNKYHYHFGNDHLRNASVTMIFEDIGDRMKKVIDQKSSAKKFAGYFGHDHNFYSYLIIFLGTDQALALKYPNAPFGANLVFELLKSKTDQQNYVRVRYNDDILKLQQCKSEPCAWQEFAQIIDDTIIDNLADWCNS